MPYNPSVMLEDDRAEKMHLTIKEDTPTPIAWLKYFAGVGVDFVLIPQSIKDRARGKKKK
jgi:hypothetical protein